MQPSWYSFSSWPLIDITPLGHLATCTFFGLAFFLYSRGIGYNDYYFFVKLVEICGTHYYTV